MKWKSGNIYSIASIYLSVPLLAACGGGGSEFTDSSPHNNFTSIHGIYASACSVSPNGTDSEIYALNIGPHQESNRADFSFNARTYSKAGCVHANKMADVTVTGTFTRATATKTITAQNAVFSVFSGGLNKSGTAHIVEIGISGVTLSKWIGSFPFNVLTARAGYLAEGSNLYFLVNPQNETDGVGTYFSPIYLTKQ